MNFLGFNEVPELLILGKCGPGRAYNIWNNSKDRDDMVAKLISERKESLDNGTITEKEFDDYVIYIENRNVLLDDFLSTHQVTI